MAKKILLLMAAFLFWFSLYIYIPYLTPELMAIGVSASLAGVIVALHSILQMIARFPAGIRSGVTGRNKWMVICGMLFSAAAAFIMYIQPSPWLFAIGNAVSGFSSAMYVGITVLYAHYYPADRSNHAMGLITTFSNLGILAAFLIGGFAWDAGGIRLILLIACIVALIGFVVSLFVEDVQLPPSGGPLKDMRIVAKNRQLLVSSILCVFVKLIVFGSAFSFTPKIAQDIGASGVELGVINALFIGASVLGSYFITTPAGRRMGDFAISVAGFCILAFYAASIPFVHSIALFMVVQFIGGLGYSSLTTIFMANAVRKLKPAHKSAGMGLYQALYSAGSALGPIVVGFFTDLVSKSAGFIILAAVACAGAVMSIWAHRQRLVQ